MMEGKIEEGGQAPVETVLQLEEAEENTSPGCKSKLPDWLKRKWTSVEKMLFTLILLNILTLVVVSLPYIAWLLNGEFIYRTRVIINRS